MLLGYQTMAPFQSDTPSPTGAAECCPASPGSLQQRLPRANGCRGWNGESRGLGRQGGTSLLCGQQGPSVCRSLVAAAPLPGCEIQDCPAAHLACPGAGHIHNPRAEAVLELHMNRKSPLLRLRAVPAGTPAVAAQPGPKPCAQSSRLI